MTDDELQIWRAEMRSRRAKLRGLARRWFNVKVYPSSQTYKELVKLLHYGTYGDQKRLENYWSELMRNHAYFKPKSPILRP